MALDCGWARIIDTEASTCRDYNRADATEWCGKILMVNEAEMENRRDAANDPSTNLSPIVLAQIGLKEPHVYRPSPVVLNRGVERTAVSYGWPPNV
jgi:hypothetical protein